MWLNCRIVAALVWWRSKRRTWHAVRRSFSSGGIFYHAGVFAIHNGNLYLIEYSPRESARKFTPLDRGASIFLFNGVYYLHRYKFDCVVEGSSFEDAAKKMAMHELDEVSALHHEHCR